MLCTNPALFVDLHHPTPFSLPEYWRYLADFFRKSFGLTEVASALEFAATELDSSLDTWLNEPLCLADAAEESGYSKDHLARLIKEGRIPQSGSPGSPKIRRQDLPRKSPSHAHGATKETVSDQIVSKIKSGRNPERAA